jgi:chromosomal replication initiation ATPase DnaA
MITEIIRACARLFRLPTNHVTGLQRMDGAREARFALYAALRKRGHSYKTIGKFLRRDHSTIMHGVRAAEAMMAADPGYAAKVAELAAWQPARVYTEETTS